MQYLSHKMTGYDYKALRTLIEKWLATRKIQSPHPPDILVNDLVQLLRDGHHFAFDYMHLAHGKWEKIP